MTSTDRPTDRPCDRTTDRPADERTSVDRPDRRIAVIGLAVRLPGAEDAVDLAHFLHQDGTEVGEVPPGRWRRELYLGDGPHQGSHHRGAFLLDPYSFDHAAFGLSAEDALHLDPQQRTMLEVGARALEDSGQLGAGRRRLNAGVFIGARMNSYGFDHGRGLAARLPEAARPAALWGRSQNFLAAWLSDRLDLSGPSLVVDTACSSSLTALWLACQSLTADACDLAVVGGVDLLIDPLTFVLLSRTGALSPDGLCHTFDGRANGYVPGEGAVALVLKPMAAALADGDHVLGAISASAVNNDGATMGVTTPNLDAQVELLDRVYRSVDPATVQYVEAHGTGTAIGDPIETRALTEVFGRHGVPRNAVALGSLKRRIGHLHSASGLAALAKVLVLLREGVIPAAGVPAPNPRLGLDTGPFHLPIAAVPWPEAPVRRAAVSGFGFGGTNAHVVAEAVPDSVPEPHPPAPGRAVHVLPLSAGTPYALRELAAQWLGLLTVDPADPADACATARLARPHRAERTAVTGADAAELAAALRTWLLGGAPEPRTTVRIRPVAAPTPPAWLAALDRTLPAVREVLDLFEAATGTELASFSGELLRISEGVALAVALRGLGLPAEAVDLPAGWEAVREFAWGSTPLEQALADVLRQEADAEAVADQGADTAELCARLDRAQGEQEVAGTLAATVAELFAAGREIDWAAFQGGRAWRKRPLPAAQSTGPALDLREPLRSAEPGTPTVLDSDEGAAGYTFSRVFGPGEAPIAQHAVYRRTMLPGVAWFDFLREGATVRGEAFHGLGDVLFHRPLIPTAARRVVCRVDGEGRFTVQDGESGEPFVTGRYLARRAPQPAAVPLAALLDTCSAELHAGSRLYRWLRRIGYHHGRYYRNISWVAGLPDGGTLARIEGERQRELNPGGVELYPGLLDSVTIAAIAPDNPVFGAAEASAFIPLSVGRLEVHGPLAEAAYVRTETAFWNDEACRVTQTVTDAAGRPLLVLADISSKRVPTAAFEEHPEPAGRHSDDAAPEARPTPDAASAPALEPEPAPVAVPQSTAPAPARPVDPAVRILAWFLELTGTAEADADTEFLSAGSDSVGLVSLSERISREQGLSLYPTVFFEYPTPRRFAAFLAEEAPELAATLPAPTGPAPTGPAPATDTPAAEQHRPRPAPARPAPARPAPAAPARAATANTPRPRDIAVVGAAVRLPTAAGLAEFAELLREGRDTVRPLPADRRHPGAPVPEASFLDRVDGFDPAPFRISPREAPLIDPQARIVYETIWEALEDGGRSGARAEGATTGLWIAYSHDHYHEERVRHGVADGRGLGLEAMIANRLSYLMDWHGPSTLVNTLCSSSLVALHTAVQHLRSGDVDTAVIGAVHAGISPEYFRSMGDLMALSPRHRCRSFDDGADGFVPGEGAVAVVLRRHADAERDGDRVRGLVRGTAVNHGGRTTRYSAPSPAAQRDVVSAALRDAEVSPETIDLVEAHGTGTRLGDPIEVDGLTRAWREHTDRAQFCALGSVKSNVGHLEPAAGLTGLVKVLLGLEHEQLWPTLHVTRPNDHIRFESTPFHLVDRARPWPRGERPRRAAVSAFGMGGVNAHVIVEEAPAAAAPAPLAQDSHLVRLGAASEPALRALAAAYAGQVAALPATGLGDFARTANTARAAHRHRALVHGGTPAELAARLAAVAEGGAPAARHSGGPARTAFLFTGQGSQYPGMGEGLYATEPGFRAALDECAALLAPHTDVPLLDLLHGDARHLLDETRYAQIGIVSVQVALVRWLAAAGVRPDAVAGHSLGELTAAWAAGVLTLPDLLRLTALRGRLMQDQPRGGAMAVVHTDADTLSGLLARYPGLELAAHNAPRQHTVSGPAGAVERLRAESTERVQPLTVSHAFHSALMDGAVAPFAEAVAGVQLAPPVLPFVSTLTGTWHTAGTATDPQYWARAIRRPVRFAEAAATLGQESPDTVWEIGPQPHLLPLARAAHTGDHPEWIATLRRGRGDQAQLHAALAAQHDRTGAEPRWSALHEGKGQRITTLPTYPFHRQRYWITAAAPNPDEHTEHTKRAEHHG
ncbi:beta-ketoacyl synthase N-terminal-like domain-containing protein [Kitasatospora sp. NPDC059146]|uniref:beta-ketoacyl synthase N-terminal-like domain-containing protein n=1 Tax=Kitasatospora sp. NPDC059146 TaxID=3346741 RepID=UPI0036A0DC7B